MLVTSATVSLFASAAICLAVIALDVARGRSIKMLGAGSAIAVRRASAAIVTLVDPSLSTSAVKLAVDAGMFVISLVSIADALPVHAAICAAKWSMPRPRQMPGFIRANYIITGGLDRRLPIDDDRQCR